MPEKPPLKLVVEPDEYLCMWTVPGTDGGSVDLPGSITMSADGLPQGDIHGPMPLQWATSETGAPSAGFPQYVHRDVLVAQLANGLTAYLLDARVTYTWPTLGSIHASAAVVGSALEVSKPVPTFKRVEIQIGALDSLAGVAPFEEWTFPPDPHRHLEGQWSVRGNPDSSQEWADKGVNLRLEYDASISMGNRYAFRFVVSPVARIEAAEALTLRGWVDDWVQPLRRVASIATGFPQPLTYLAVRPGREDMQSYRKAQVFGSHITQQPYQSSEQKIRENRTALLLAHDKVSLLDMLRRWQALESEGHPLIETYGAMLHSPDQHPRSRFLLLVQALEGLHGHETADAYEARRGQHTAQRDALLATIEASKILNAAATWFLKRNLSRNPPRGLDQALRDLVGTLPVNLMPRLDAAKIVQDVIASETGINTTFEALAKIRNDLAHGNRGYDVYDLNELVTTLECVVRAHALRLLGCPEAVQKRVLNPEE